MDFFYRQISILFLMDHQKGEGEELEWQLGRLKVLDSPLPWLSY